MSIAKIDWRGLGRAYVFFWFFPGLCHLLLLFSGATGFLPTRQGIVYSTLWLIPLLLFPQRTRLITAAIGLVLWALSLLNLGYFAIYGHEFSQSVLFIVFETNPAEAGEYIDQYLVWWMLPAALIYSGGTFWLWRWVRPLDMAPKASRVLCVLIAIALAAPPTVKALRKKNANARLLAESFISRVESVIPWQFAFSLLNYRHDLAEMQALLERSKSIPPIANLKNLRAGQPTTLVLVIGESTNRQHMSLYGYPRRTTPKLDAMRDQLAVFNQIYAPRPYTIEVLQQVLTFADQENPNLYLTRPSLMNIMKQAGYKTYWITNQQTLTKRNTMLTNFSEQTDEQYYLNHSLSQNSYQFDGNVLEPFKRVLDDAAERKFIVVHLLGTHIRYKYRYPDDYAIFKGKENLPAWVKDDQVAPINEYDNAVLYNDHVVSSLINSLSTAGGSTSLVYFSDHGEDVYDWPDHRFIGRNEASPTPPMYSVPFFIWTSEQWKHQDPRKFNGQLDRVYQTSHFIHTWADLVGLRFEGFEPSKSLINPSFQERPVLVGNPANPQGLVDLRAMLKK